MSSPSVLVFIAQGTEEMEFVTTYDVLVRAGCTVRSVYVGSYSEDSSDPHGAAQFATCTRGVRILPDLRLTDLEKGKALGYDAVVVPGGGPGAKTISENTSVQDLIKRYFADGKIVATICAGTLAVKTSGIAPDSSVTSHPSVQNQLTKGEYGVK